MTTAILGGGLTGLTLARLLQEKGEDVIVLEQEEAIGGLCRSHTGDGYTFDIGGSHIIFSRDVEVLAWMREVIGENQDERERNTKIFYKGSYVKYPFENGLSQLPEEDRFFCINEFVRTLIEAEKGTLPAPQNFRDWIYTTFGKGIAECYMVPYNEKIWNYPTEKMSYHWVDGRIPRPPVEDIIRSAIGIETEGYTHQSVFSYPVTGGIEALIGAVAAPVQERIRTGFKVTSVTRDDDGAFLISDGRENIRAENCISTIPLQHLLPCLAAVPEDVMSACTALRYNSLACICLGVRGDVAPYSWLYIPQKELGMFNRISFPSNYSTEVAPENCSSILAEITYNDGDAVSNMPDDELISHTVDGLTEMGLLTPSDVTYASVFRQKFAYVVYDLEYQDNVVVVRNFAESMGIQQVGRFAEFEYLNMDGCIRHVFDFIEKLNPD
ncbi:FAD-dependent oxidoreductase [Methanomicrobiaceae archaeon CYW5]|uniref:protoporphyrinogen/coproporphyrinogen oxidase n=1 Tax=Methanovulcanius yangii TaxID=1789227 RepID=UPI0029CA1D77|nr:FAD-dependent oxidoreductase [Methanovulcanius yangii]MBT8507268.1 FAD-dependent oxidoreductase [Methanovulcanius yangii]